jgi:hypothetical protein
MPGARFTRTDLYRPGPHRDATIYKGKNFLSAKPLRIKLTEVLNVPRVGMLHALLGSYANRSGSAYFCHLERTLLAGGELVEPFSVQDSP